MICRRIALVVVLASVTPAGACAPKGESAAKKQIDLFVHHAPEDGTGTPVTATIHLP